MGAASDYKISLLISSPPSQEPVLKIIESIHLIHPVRWWVGEISKVVATVKTYSLQGIPKVTSHRDRC